MEGLKNEQAIASSDGVDSPNCSQSDAVAAPLREIGALAGEETMWVDFQPGSPLIKEVEIYGSQFGSYYNPVTLTGRTFVDPQAQGVRITQKSHDGR
jgi:hypothetical protein